MGQDQCSARNGLYLGRSEHVDGERQDADVEEECGEAMDRYNAADALVGDGHIGRLERHPERECEIDEVPVNRLLGVGKFETGAAAIRIDVGKMRIMQRVD